MIRVGFIGALSKEWMGGLNYFKNLLFALDAVGTKELEIFVFVGKKTDTDIKNMFKKHANVIEDSLFDRKSIKWFFSKLGLKIFKSKDPKSCLKTFKSNNMLGFLVLLNLLIGKIFTI